MPGSPRLQPQLDVPALRRKSVLYRKRLLEIIKQAGAGHTGGGLSCIDMLNVLYNRVLNVSPAAVRDPRRDRYVQSKGHCVEALYVTLADCGFVRDADLDSLCRYQSHFVGHPTRKIAGVEQNTGALGHGLSVCVGMAIAARKDGNDCRIYTLLGDGELAEGSNWEAAMSAAHYRLGNLTALIDYNTLQITGHTRDLCSNEPIDAKFSAFGWDVLSVDGNDVAALVTALEKPTVTDRPRVIIANTVKGKGISFMEGVARWHHGVPNDDEYHRAQQELDAALAGLPGAP